MASSDVAWKPRSMNTVRAASRRLWRVTSACSVRVRRFAIPVVLQYRRYRSQARGMEAPQGAPGSVPAVWRSDGRGTTLGVAGFGRPVDRFVELVVVEATDFSLDEMLGDVRSDARELRVGRERNPVDVPMMLSHETDVPQEAREIFPSGKLARVDDQSRQPPVIANPAIGSFRE